jgi:hypothetical protein
MSQGGLWISIHNFHRAPLWKNLQSVFDWYGQVTKGVWGMSRCREAMKDVADCDKFRAGVEQPLILKCPNGETRSQEIGIISGWIHRPVEANAGNWNISVPVGKEINWDSVSSGERKRISLNRSSGRCYGHWLGVTKASQVKSAGKLSRRRW